VTDKDPYRYPGSSVLRNKLGITDPDLFERIERRLVVQRAAEGVPAGKFDLAHLRKIHRHLFQDLFDWAGELRTVEIAKGGSQFQLRRFIETGMADVHRRLVAQGFLRGLDDAAFALAAAAILGDVNYVHPFREGNGRTQLLYFEQLAEKAGHPIDLRRLERDRWIKASRTAHQGDYRPMAEAIQEALVVRR
jgi:cell filamentation protein